MYKIFRDRRETKKTWKYDDKFTINGGKNRNNTEKSSRTNETHSSSHFITERSYSKSPGISAIFLNEKAFCTQQKAFFLAPIYLTPLTKVRIDKGFSPLYLCNIFTFNLFAILKYYDPMNNVTTPPFLQTSTNRIYLIALYPVVTCGLR